jgi:hypothetical protein
MIQKGTGGRGFSIAEGTGGWIEDSEDPSQIMQVNVDENICVYLSDQRFLCGWAGGPRSAEVPGIPIRRESACLAPLGKGAEVRATSK